jgi:biotin carboxylase
MGSRVGRRSTQPAVAALLDHARAVIGIEPFDDPRLERAALALHTAHPIDAVICLIDIRLVEAARLARRLGLRFLNLETAILTRDKFAVRERLAASDIAQQHYRLATSGAELSQAVDQLGLPLIIKPSDGYGSRNIVVLRDPEDLDPFLSPVDTLLPSGASYGLGVMANDRLVVERYVSGRVIGCDTFTRNGRHELLGVNERQFFDQPSFAIRGVCFSPNSPAFAGVERYVSAVLDAIAFDWGAAHTELIVGSDSLWVVEVNARLVGAKIAKLAGHALGRSVYADLIGLHLGEPALPPSPDPCFAASRWVVAESGGILSRIEHAPVTPSAVRSFEAHKSIGDHVGPPFENADRIGCVMATRRGSSPVFEARRK